jgi:hypothetical protein
MSPNRHQRSWRNYLVNAQYQLRFTLFLVGVCAILMVGLGKWVMDRAEIATTIGIQDARANEQFVDPQPTIRALEAQEARIGYLLVGMGVFLCLGLFAYGITMTHKVAGPLYKVAGYFDKVKSGTYAPVYSLRKGDQLVEFYDHFREAHAALRRRQEQDLECLKRVLDASRQAGLAATSGDLEARLLELEALAKGKEESLG